MRVFITGGAGFIGSHLVERLARENNDIVAFDNLSSGKKAFLPLKNSHIQFIHADVLDYKNLVSAMHGCDIVYHFAANSHVQKGAEHTYLDLQQGIMATHNVLEAMRENQIKKIVFPSSMTVYGVPQKEAFSETYGPCLPISLYAAAKLGAEGFISAYASLYGMRAWIFRFANVIGLHLTHGVIYDLVHKLLKDNDLLDVLGNGTQTKPYIFVEDIIDAITFVVSRTHDTVNLYNLGVADAISVREIVEIIVEKMKLQPKVTYASTSYGWIGDVTQCALDSTKVSQLGFTPKYSSKEAVEKTIDGILREVGFVS